MLHLRTLALALLVVGCGTRTGSLGVRDSGGLAPDDGEPGPELVADAAFDTTTSMEANQAEQTALGRDAGLSTDSAFAEARSSDEQATDTPISDGAQASEAAVDACAFVDNGTFLATEMHECGVLPGGKFVGCFWTLVFQNDGVHRRMCWAHSDLLEDMTYQCEGWTVKAASRFGLSYSGTYDPTSGTLSWESMEYRRASVDAAAPNPFNFPP